eukprot:907834-Rhodomonas_salina.3
MSIPHSLTRTVPGIPIALACSPVSVLRLGAPCYQDYIKMAPDGRNRTASPRVVHSGQVARLWAYGIRLGQCSSLTWA